MVGVVSLLDLVRRFALGLAALLELRCSLECTENTNMLVSNKKTKAKASITHAA